MSRLLEVRRIVKRFPGVTALDGVELHVAAGEIVAVIGENGAGKSTLMKILAGVQVPDAGEILWEGRRVEIGSVQQAEALGVTLIHQELNLCDNLNVGANIFLGREPIRWGLIDKRRIRRDARRVLDMVGLDVDPDLRTSTLTIGRQQMVEIAKALAVESQVLIMDEPTSSLSQHETERLFEVIEQLRSRGVSIVYISHRLGEVKRLADRVVVLRDGRNAGQLARDEISHDTMVGMMVGRDVSQFYARTAHAIGDVVLAARDLRTPAHPRSSLNFHVRAGEIIGIAGLVGAGRTELLETLFGIDPPLGGTVEVDGKPLTPRHAWDAIRAGMALVPEDRKQHGVVLEMDVRQNIGLAGLWAHRRRGVFRPSQWEESRAVEMQRQLSIKTPSLEQHVRFLSGGNQQKVVLGKWLALAPHVLLLDEPTRGIDVGAKQEIYQTIETLARRGMAILFVSSEMEEILGLSDRVLVMHEGRLAGELPRDALSEEAVMHLATGGRADAMPEAQERNSRP